MTTLDELTKTLARNPRLEGVPRDDVSKEAAWLVSRLERLTEVGIEPTDAEMDRMVDECINGLIAERPV